MQVASDMTIYTAAELLQPLLAAARSGTECAVDLSQVGEIDSAGVQLLLLARREAAAAGARLHVSGASPAVREVLQMLRLDADLGLPGAQPRSNA